MKNTAENTGAIEAILFAYGEPMPLKKIAALLDISPAETTAAISALKEKLENEGGPAHRSLGGGGGGLALIAHDGNVQLVTRPEYGALIAKLLKAESQEELTPASQETLAIVAYAGPIARADIDYIRGVNSSFILRALLMRGLIDRAPDPHRGNAYVYTPSFDCLKYMGVTSAADLPDYQKYRALAEKMATANTVPAEVSGGNHDARENGAKQ